MDGEYEISVRLQTGQYDEYLGMRRDRKLDLRLDDQRLELFNLRIKRKTTAAKSLYVLSRGRAAKSVALRIMIVPPPG